ncbi:MAG: DNA topoisomerase 3 [Bacteroidota bacterium]
MKVIIAEKPIVAKSIAKVLKVSNKKDGYFENSHYRISWFFGHLVGLAMPEDYDQSLKKWRQETLPILPNEFKLKVKSDAGVRKQFNVLKEIMHQADEVICATDNDREGDLIFHYVYKLSGCRTPYVRILPNDLSDNGIKKALAKTIPPRNEVIRSAQCRSESDWLIGINATRAITIASNTKISIGRVQTPTLAIVCQRYLENKNFKPTPFYPITIDIEKEGITFKARINHNPTDENVAKNIVSSVSDTSTCTASEKKRDEEKQPLPYYLSTLQIGAFNTFGFSAQKTLDLAQALYEKHKLTTYPRTDSGYLTSDLYNEVPDLLNKVIDLFGDSSYKKVINFSDLPQTCINDKKAPNHHGIIPTSNLSSYGSLSGDEKKLFDLIAKRFLAAFANKCIKDKTRYEFDNAGQLFISTGSITIENGWKDIYQNSEEKEEDKEEQVTLPDVNENDVLPTSNAQYSTSMTKAPALLTQATLLELMKSCGSRMDDEELKRAMKDNALRTGGLGTEATRAGIIENLFSISLITNDKKKIVPTDMGLSLYEQVRDLDLSKPEMTASWELKLDQVASGEFSSAAFISQIKDYTKTVTAAMLKAGSKVDTDNLKLTCPKCLKGNIIEGKKGYGCSRWKAEDPCNFVVWKEKSGKQLSLMQVKEIITLGRTKSKIKGFKKKEGEDTFEAALTLNKETWNVEFNFATTNAKGETIKCPQCGKEIRMNKAGAFCVDSDDCGFKIWRKKSEKVLTDANLNTLIIKGKLPKVKGFKSKAGKPFDAALTLEKNGHLTFVFNKN